MQKSVFQSRISFQDAANRAMSVGFTPTGQIFRNGLFIVFAAKQEQPVQQHSISGSDWLRGRL